MRSVLGELLESGAGYDFVIVDMEAGLEHLSRGTTRHVDRLLAVAEPYYRSLETARRVCGLAAELGIGQVQLLPNKVRDAGDAEAIREFGDRHALHVIAGIPYDETIADADRRGDPHLALEGGISTAMARIRRIADDVAAGSAFASPTSAAVSPRREGA